MTCQSCGGTVAAGAQFCQTCGAPVSAAPPSGYAPPQPTYPGQPYGAQPYGAGPGPMAPVPQPRKRSIIKILLVVAVVGILVFVGAIVAIFFGARQMLKNSDANKAAVLALKESPAVAEALGEITDTGTPMGSISTEMGGSGRASLSMSVEGSKASGRYYVTLIRRNGRWLVVSGRVELNDGRSIELGTGRLLR